MIHAAHRPNPHHFVAIVNPVSGRRGVTSTMRRIAELIDRRGGHLSVQTTKGAGHATELAAAIPNDVKAVLIVGGDGTVCEVTNGLIGREIPAVVLSAGTENLVARHLNMPRTATEMVDTLFIGKPCRCDLYKINDRHFVALAGVGFDAECVHRLAQTRRGHITHIDYFWPIWRTFWSHRFPELCVKLDGQTLFNGRGFVLICGIGRYALDMQVFPRARMDDGLLDVSIFPCSNRLHLIDLARQILWGLPVTENSVICRQGKNLSIESVRPTPVQADGDPIGDLPIGCSVLPGAATFLARPDATNLMR